MSECIWEKGTEGYDTQCGQRYYCDANPNGEICPHCGKKIKVQELK
jgi:hypothetical protein